MHFISGEIILRLLTASAFRREDNIKIDFMGMWWGKCGLI